MKSSENIGGGTTFILDNGDLLSEVPESHSDIVTPEILAAFANPVQYFEMIAKRTPISSFRHYLELMTISGQWSLVLADTHMCTRNTIGAFQWKHPNQCTTLIAPGNSNSIHGPFAAFYCDVRMVHWTDIGSRGQEIGYGGGMFPFAEHIRLDHYGIPSEDERFLDDSTFVFGSSSCGDVMVYNSNGLAGYMSHEDGRAKSIGTIPEMLEWIFSELSENRTPELDYELL